jgi:MFS family permease
MKNKKALLLLFSANTISGFAQGISMLAIPWYFTSTIGKPALFGTMYAAVTFLTIFWSLYCGTLIDRFPRKNIFLITNVCGGIILAGAAITGYVLGYIPVAMVMFVFAATMFVYNIHYPTLYAFGQELTEKNNYRKVTSYIEIIGQSTNMLGGAAAAILLNGTTNGVFNLLGFQIHLPFDIKAWGLQDIFIADACTYFIAIALILFIKYSPVVALEIDTAGIFQRVKTGINFLKDRPFLFLFGNCSYSVFVVLLIEVHFLLPLYVNNYLEAGADVYASSEVYYTIGALLAGIGIQWFLKTASEVKAIIIKMIITVIGFVVCAFTKSVLIFFVFSFIIGITNAGIRILRTSWLFSHVPNNLIGRTGGVFHVLNTLQRTLLIALFSIPFFADGANITWAYFISGGFVLLNLLPLAANVKRLENWSV